MNARIPCLASMDEARHAREQDAAEAREEALDALVAREYFPQPCTAELIESGMAAMPADVAQKLALACAQLGPSYHGGQNDAALQAVGSAFVDWMFEHAYCCADADLVAASCSNIRRRLGVTPPRKRRHTLAHQPLTDEQISAIIQQTEDSCMYGRDHNGWLHQVARAIERAVLAAAPQESP